MPTLEQEAEKWKARGRAAWWTLTIILLIAYIFARWDEIHAGKPNPLDFLLFVVLVALWILPLATEIKIWGFQIKREVRKLRKEVTSLQQTITATSQASASQAVHVTTFDPRALLDLLRQDTRSEKHDAKASLSTQEATVSPPPKDAQFAFNTRYQIETELTRLLQVATKRTGRDAVIFGGSELRVAYLENCGVLNKNLAAALRQVLAAANQLVHGAVLGDDENKVFKKGAMFAIAELESIKA